MMATSWFSHPLRSAPLSIYKNGILLLPECPWVTLFYFSVKKVLPVNFELLYLFLLIGVFAY